MDYKKILVAMVVTAGIIGFSSNESVAATKAKEPLSFDEPVLLNPQRVQPSVPKSTTATLSPIIKKHSTSQKTISTKIQYTRYKKVKKTSPKKINYGQIDKLIENSYFEKADSLLDSAISTNSKDIKARALRVVSLAKQLKLDPAQKELDVLLKTYPKCADLHYAQGIVHYKRTTSSNMIYLTNSQHLYEEALSEFKNAIELDSKDARYYNAAGVASLKLEKYNDAKEFFKKAVHLDCKYSTAIDNLGTVDFEEEKLAEAEKKFNQALLYNTQNTTAMYHLAQVYLQKGQYDKALYHLNNALAINDNSDTTYNLMGKIYELQGNEAAAINAYKKAIMVKPEFSIPYFNLAEIYERRGDGEFAIEELKTALSLNPDCNDAKLKIADISLASGKYQQSIDNYSALLGVNEYNADAIKGLAAAYFEKAQLSSTKGEFTTNKDLIQAYDYVNKATELDGEDLELHLAKLKLAKITNQKAVSKEALQKIIQSPQTDLISLVSKGEAYLSLNNYDEAKKAFAQAALSTKGNEDDLYLSEIFIYHKQFENAEVVLQKVLKTACIGSLEVRQAQTSLEYIQNCKKLSSESFKSAQYYMKNKNQSVAVEYLRRALALNADNIEARLLLAETFEKQKNYQAAAENYRVFLSLTVNSDDRKRIEKKIRQLTDKM